MEAQVRLESYRRGRHEHGTKIVVTGLGHGAGGLSLRREGLGTRAGLRSRSRSSIPRRGAHPS